LRRDKLGFVFQFFNLLRVLTAEENLVAAALDRGTQARPGVGRPADRSRRLEDRRTPTGRASSRRPSSSGVAVARRWVSKRRSSSPTSDRQPRLEGEPDVLDLLRRAVDRSSTRQW